MIPDAPLFQITQGCFSYGNTPIFTDLDFCLKRGAFYGLIGPNGSGKSTLIDLLMGIKKLSSGSIAFNSQPLHNYKRREIAQHLALVPQNISIGFEFSVHDIVLMGRHPHISRFAQPSQYDMQTVQQTLQLLDIEHLKNRPVTNLSGGEKQRVIVARALAQETDVLMLDEGTSNLDIEHTIEIMRVLKKKVQNQQTTIIVAIHDLNFAAAFCDELLVLKDFKLYKTGPVNEILTTELLQEVFSVDGDVIHGGSYPKIEYQMYPTLDTNNLP